LSEWKLRCPLGGPKYKHEHEEALFFFGKWEGIFESCYEIEESIGRIPISKMGGCFEREFLEEFPFPHMGSDGQALSFARCFTETLSDRWSWRMLWDCWCDAT